MSLGWNSGPQSNGPQWGGPGFGSAAAARTVSQAQLDEGLRQHMLRVYNYMGAALAITGVLSFAMFASGLALALAQNKILYIAIALSPLAFMFIFPRVPSMSVTGAQMSLFAYASIFGVALSPIFLVYTGASIAKVFFIAAAMFFSASLFGYTTRRDMSKMGGFLMMGAIGLMIAMVVNIFLASPMMQFVISVIGVLLFTVMTAYDTQAIKETYTEAYGHEMNQKLAVLGAVSLYGNFVMIFQFLLSLMGERE